MILKHNLIVKSRILNTLIVSQKERVKASFENIGVIGSAVDAIFAILECIQLATYV